MPGRDEVEYALAWQQYVDQHGKEPTNEDGSDTAAVDLYRWMWRTRKLLENNEIAELASRRLDLLAPSWRRQPIIEAQREEHGKYARAYRDFIARTKRYPWARSADDYDRELAQWFLGARAAYDSGELPASVVREIQANLPDWTRTRRPVFELTQRHSKNRRTITARQGHAARQEILTQPSVSARRIEDVAAFLAEHDRLPELSAAGPEHDHAAWLVECVNVADEELNERLDYTFPGWREKYGAAGDRQAREDKADVEETKLPSTLRPDGGKCLVEYIDSRESLDEVDLVVISVDKKHPGLAQSAPYAFARLALEAGRA